MIDHARQPWSDDAGKPSPDDEPVLAAETLRLLQREFVAHVGAWRTYFATRADSIRYGIGKLAFRIGAALFGLVAAVALTVTASILLLTGIAAFVSAQFPRQPWSGPVAVGALGLFGIAGLIALARFKWSRSFRAHLERKYGSRAAAPGAARGPIGGSGLS